MRTISHQPAAGDGVTIIHDASIADVSGLDIDPGLTSLMRSPTVRRSVLLKLAADPAARLTLAVHDRRIIGHLAVGPSFGRWKDLPHIREVAFEVSRDWRHRGIATRMTDIASADPEVENEIQLAFFWPSAWDLDHERLNRMSYRDLLAGFTARYGFRRVGTDEPEIRLQQGGALAARIGARVPCHAVAAFARARYQAPRRRRLAA
jgi:hypothetical protein